MKKLRISHFPQIPCQPFTVEVKDLEEAKKIREWARKQIGGIGMSKERLEDLAYNVGISLDGEKVIMSNDDYDFLYKYALQQAERVQELEEVLLQNKYDKALYEKRVIEWLELKEENKRYREAMKTALKVSEYYNAFGGDLEKVIADIHNILDKALESDNDE